MLKITVKRGCIGAAAVLFYRKTKIIKDHPRVSNVIFIYAKSNNIYVDYQFKCGRNE
ncbi:Uncharacterized protein APZ42_032168 [Daphnia magna]|uniref:Uncharacterized protein n=1 Tax=Daphnia magna TaxID=35525 RepID=A0A164M6T8_9CRUS|nr:Uncharacterized protein APZ42_032168 [Daphnia magna]